MLTRDGRLFLLTMPGYRLFVDPVGATATFADGGAIHGVAMTRDFVPVARHSRAVRGAEDSTAARISRALFPLRLSLAGGQGGYLGWQIAWGGWAALA
ncbi:hypothetical protein [Rhodovulum euryhalinum]|uniref:hypothetical protein n=1 Tax=Rhodovulum euryhalinum TaxID=35805 RepID=UPI001FB23C27|nr:hypothetical protein [Rhodovulum euryhalinum]